MHSGRGPTRKKRDVAQEIWLCCFALVAIAMLYGVFCYPYAPIRLRDDGFYRDKSGRQFTEAQFRRFTIWERCLLTSFGVLAASSIALALSQRRRRTAPNGVVI